MMFRCEPTGMGIMVALPSCGATSMVSKESVSWAIRPASGDHPRLKKGPELKELRGRAVVTRAGDGQQRAGRICSYQERDATPEHYAIELHAPDEVFARIVKFVEEGKPPTLELVPDGSGRIWDNELDPTITLKSWRAEIQVTPDEEHETTTPPSPIEAQLGRIQRSIASARAAAWVTALAAALLVLLRLH
jgi:hypothetical protein